MIFNTKYLHELIGILIVTKVNNVFILNSKGDFNWILPMLPTWQYPFILGIVCLYNFLFPEDFWIMICAFSINISLNNRIHDFRNYDCINIHRMVHVGTVNGHSHIVVAQSLFFYVFIGMPLYNEPLYYAKMFYSHQKMHIISMLSLVL